jgi:hypothetical protein
MQLQPFTSRSRRLSLASSRFNPILPALLHEALRNAEKRAFPSISKNWPEGRVLVPDELLLIRETYPVVKSACPDFSVIPVDTFRGVCENPHHERYVPHRERCGSSSPCTAGARIAPGPETRCGGDGTRKVDCLSGSDDTHRKEGGGFFFAGETMESKRSRQESEL